jgi:hypothetical protein
VAYDEDLAWRVREQLDGVDAVSERRMFGGLALLVGGHMALAVSGRGGLMVRTDGDFGGEPHTEPVVMRGRPMRGWIRVAAAGLEGSEALAEWIGRGLMAAEARPPKHQSL